MSFWPCISKDTTVDEPAPKPKNKFGVADIRLLVVGTGNSGKSTILKQLKILKMGGFSIDELAMLRPNIYDSMVTSMNMLVKSMKDCNIRYENNDRASDAKVCGVGDDKTVKNPLSGKLGDAITELWADGGLQEAYLEQAENIHLANGAKYLFDGVERIRQMDYVPSYQDILECRTMTAGAVKMDFEYGGLQFSITDMGGQKNVRKKWAYFYQEVQGILFVAALSEYDQAMTEDASTNRIHDALLTFTEMANNPALSEKPIMLFFNKVDLFREKIKKVPLTVAFKEFKGGTDFEAAKQFVLGEFMKGIQASDAKSLVKRKGTIYPFFTHATSSKDMNFIIDNVLNIAKMKMFYAQS